MKIYGISWVPPFAYRSRNVTYLWNMSVPSIHLTCAGPVQRTGNNQHGRYTKLAIVST
jgi:hypothetical protein